jgi:hypothetical protein
MTRPSQRREPYGKCEHLPAGQWIAGKAVALRGVSIALACRTFEVSETCYRYSAKLNEENEQIADPHRADTGKEELGLRPVLPLPAQCPGAFVESQTGLPDIPRSGIEPADQAKKALEAGQTRYAGRPGSTEHGLVDGLHGRPPGGRQAVSAAECAG